VELICVSGTEAAARVIAVVIGHESGVGFKPEPKGSGPAARTTTGRKNRICGDLIRDRHLSVTRISSHVMNIGIGVLPEQIGVRLQRIANLLPLGTAPSRR